MIIGLPVRILGHQAEVAVKFGGQENKMTRISHWISIYTQAASFPIVITVPFSISRMFSEPKNTLKAFLNALSRSPAYF